MTYCKCRYDWQLVVITQLREEFIKHSRHELLVGHNHMHGIVECLIAFLIDAFLINEFFNDVSCCFSMFGTHPG